MATERTTQNAPLEPHGKQALQRERTRPGLAFRPDVDIAESREEFLVTADLPGVDESHVNVRLEDGVLSIDAELAVEPDASWTPVYAEYRLGGYHREFSIPDAVDADGIRASLRDGVLELRLPKVEARKPRQIEVRSG